MIREEFTFDESMFSVMYFPRAFPPSLSLQDTAVHILLLQKLISTISKPLFVILLELNQKQKMNICVTVVEHRLPEK